MSRFSGNQNNFQKSSKISEIKNELTENWYTVAQTAKLLSKAQQTITNWCYSGKLAAIPESFGAKVTYKIPKAAIISLLEQQERKSTLKSLKVGNIEDNEKHFALIEAYDKACAQGLMGGRPFSPETRKVNKLYLTKFLEKYPVASYKNLKKELLEIPAVHFGKREKIFKVLLSFSKWLVQEGLLEASAVESLRELCPKRHQPPKRLTLTEDQLDQLEAVCKTAYDLVLVIGLSHTGLRATEFSTLKPENVHLAERKLTILGKGNKYREVGLTKRAVEAFQNYFEEHPPKKNKPIFCDRKGEPLTKRGLHHRLRKLGKRAGFYVHAHAMRRAFVTTNANKGRSLVTLQILCGHSNISTTRAYCQTTMAEAVAQIQDWD